ncbi:putative phage abortive infection protein [Hahella aquimaris]|uniref:putative phage abortive infection protein n=1 Tax=Hahella sp. HNIBRBA332 TaxID=3015983 RepID=UPI00273BEBDC|nr:putative phage abortive infection protein [Hahella sp. HNIBRBA332]WLQ15403.1 putative phage abortive infection protein [Hahella sp. HNIBRBA332]
MSQLSTYEILIMFYNCLSEFGKDKFKPLVEKYGMLEYMDGELLIDKVSHVEFYDQSAFGMNK